MSEANEDQPPARGGASLAAGSVLLATVLLAGCGSAGDALNPVHWYKGVSNWVNGAPESPKAADQGEPSGEFPQVPDDHRPAIASAAERATLAEGLAADRANAKHTQEALRREGTPTPPLNGDTALAKPLTSVVVVQPRAQGPLPAATAPTMLLPAGSAMTAPASSATRAVTAAPVPEKPPVDVAAAPPPPPAPPPNKVTSTAAAAVPPPSPPVPEKPRVDVADAPPPPPPAPDGSAAVAAPPTAANAMPPAQVAQAAPLPATSTQPPAAAPFPPKAAVGEDARLPVSVEEVYRARLAEFNNPSVKGASPFVQGAMAVAADPPPSATTLAGRPTSIGYAIHLVPPSQHRKDEVGHNGGIRPLSAFDPAHSQASFQVASVGFGEGTADLSPAGLRQLEDVVTLYREHAGRLRIFGRSSSTRLDPDPQANREANRQLANRRAEAVARALLRLGVPATHVYAGAATNARQMQPVGAASPADATEIYIDY